MFLNIVEILSDQVGTESTEAGKMLPLAPSGSENLSNATSQLEGVGCPVGVAVTIAGGGGGLFFSLFFSTICCKKTGRGNEATQDIFCHRQLRELYEADFHKPGIYGSGLVWANAWDCFVARRLEVVAVAGLLWISWCVLDLSLIHI